MLSISPATIRESGDHDVIPVGWSILLSPFLLTELSLMRFMIEVTGRSTSFDVFSHPLTPPGHFISR